MITGVFENHGATGEGTKRWANGCVYTGALLNNKIHHYGVLQWPDGRRYVGHFQDEMMHGEGMLCWSDEYGVCRYKGNFEHNMFQGEGTLEWSIKARYVGEFFNGLYHGEGTFEWPDKAHVYRGQWQFGEMSGKGTLTTSCGSIYSGEFYAGNMEGRGTITFITNDQYVGVFKDSMFNGLGTYTWSAGTSLAGVFENNFCNRVGKKTLPGGQVYVGELKNDLEHGKGVFTDGEQRIIGLWEEGKLVQQLVESIVPALEVDDDSQSAQRVFSGFKSTTAGPPTGFISSEDGSPVEGKAIVLFYNGDKYVGGLKGGKKHGQGMYVYADNSAYKGIWDEDVLEGVRHPMQGATAPAEITKLQELNDKSKSLTDNLMQLLAPQKTGAPDAAMYQD
jgi:hypothetical protein